MKNKEIEELLKGMRDVSNTDGACMNLDRYLVKLLLSYIEQLEKRNESLLEDRRELLHLVRQLENNRDKALKIIDSYDLGKYDYSIPAGGIIELRETLKGDSDDTR